MTGPHRTTLELSEPIPAEVEVGARFTLRARVICSSGCDLRGHAVTLAAPDRQIAAAELTTCEDTVNETAPLIVDVPQDVGEHAWSLLFSQDAASGTAHEGCSLPVAFATIPHATSIAVWDVPSPVAIGSRLTVKAGIKCSAGCDLTGHSVEVRDQDGATVAVGRLGQTPWPGTRALYWADIELTAPPAVGLAFWTVCVTGDGMPLAHRDASAAFSFKANPRPEHRVVLRIVGEDARTPIAGADVRLGIYRVTADDDGVAAFELPKGSYDLQLWSDGYEAPAALTIAVDADIDRHIEAVKTKTAAEQEADYERWELTQWG